MEILQLIAVFSAQAIVYHSVLLYGLWLFDCLFKASLMKIEMAANVIKLLATNVVISLFLPYCSSAISLNC